MRVLVSDTLSEQGLDILRRAPGVVVDYKPGLSEGDLAAAIGEADALVIRSGSKVTAKVIAAAAKLKVIGRAGIGVDNVDVPAASKKGIIVMNTPTGNAVTTAEHAITLLMSLARQVPQASALLKAGKWEKKKFEGVELAGKTIGVIGLGNIGRIVADRAKGLHMRVLGFDPVMTADRASALGVELATLEQIWAEAHAITVHTPLTAGTKNLINDEVVGKLKKGVLLVNCARGGIYDEAALLRGLESGKIGGVALDVFPEEPPPADSPILKHDRVVATPHLGASTKEAQDRVALEVCDQVVAYLTTGEVQNSVNVPSVSSDVAKRLTPYADLAEKLGRFIAQADGAFSPKSIEVECVGEPADLSTKVIAASAVAGFLQRFLDVPANQVSALHLAADRGIAVKETRSTAARGRYASVVVFKLELEGGKTATACGTIGADGSARLVQWNDYEVEALLGGPTLVFTSKDRPGVIGFLGTTLGAAGVNIGRVQLGKADNGNAVSIWNLDADAPGAVLEEIKRSDNISSATFLRI